MVFALMAHRILKSRDEGRPLHVVRFDDKHGISLNKEELSILLDRPDVKYSEVAVLSIAGVSRTGKSFLMNYLLRYLKKEGKGGWTGEFEEPLEGFDWRQGVEPSTRGIFMWSKPFCATSNDGRKVALLLMDTQGLFDQNLNPESASAVFTLSILLSSTQVYNIMAKIEVHHLKQLELFIEESHMVMSLLKEKQLLKSSHRIVFLVRDWLGASKYEYGPEGGRKYLISMFEASDRQSWFWERQNTIQAFYKKTDCYLMPDPGVTAMTTVSGDSSPDSQEEENKQYPLVTDFCGQLYMLGRNFRKHLLTLVPFLIGPGQLVGKEIHGRSLHENIKKYVSIFQSGLIPKCAWPHKPRVNLFNESLTNELMHSHKEMMSAKLNQLRPSHYKKTFERDIALGEHKHRLRFAWEARGGEKDKLPHRDALENIFSSSKKGFDEAFNNRILIEVLLQHRRRTEKFFQEPDMLPRKSEAVKRELERVDMETIQSFELHALGSSTDKEIFIRKITEELQFWKEYIEHQRKMKIQAFLRAIIARERIFSKYLENAKHLTTFTEESSRKICIIADTIDDCLKRTKDQAAMGLGMGTIAAAGAATLSTGGLILPIALGSLTMSAMNYFTAPEKQALFQKEFPPLRRQAYQLVMEWQSLFVRTEREFDRIINVINGNFCGFSANKILNIVLAAQTTKMPLEKFIPDVLSYFMDSSVLPPLYIDGLREVPPQRIFTTKTKTHRNLDKYIPILEKEDVFQGNFLRELQNTCKEICQSWEHITCSMTKIPRAT